MRRHCILGTFVVILCSHAASAQVKGKRPGGAAEVQITALTFAPDGKSLVSVTSSGVIRFHQVPDPMATFTWENAGDGVAALAFSKDGALLAAGHRSGVISLWDVPKKALQQRWQAHAGGVGALLWNPKDQTLVSGGYDSAIRIWRPADAKAIQTWKLPSGRVTSLAMSADGRKLFSGGIAEQHYENNSNVFITTESDLVRVWDVATGKSEKMHLRGMNVAVAPDGTMLAAAGLVSDIRRTQRGTSYDGRDRLAVFDFTNELLRMDHVCLGHLLAISADGKHLVGGGQNFDAWFGGMTAYNGVNGRRTDFRLRLWELSSAKEVLRLPEQYARAVALSPDGKFLASANGKCEITFWDIDKEKRDPTPDPNEIIAAVVDPWLAALVKDFQRLAEKSPAHANLRRAHLLLHQHNAIDAVEIIRKARAPAGVPLLLRYLVEAQTGKNSFGWDTAALADALVILTGKPLPPQPLTRPDAEAWYKSLVESLNGIGTDLKRFSSEQLRTILAVLATNKMQRRDHDEGFSPHRLHDVIHDLLAGDDDDYRSWWPHELHAAMLPLMLEPMGHGEPTPGWRNHPILWQYLPLLAELGRQGQAEHLARLAADPREDSAVRILCLWAHLAATGQLATASAIGLLRQEKKLERRVAIILALELGPPAEVKGPLLECLKDVNRHVRWAAVLALTTVKAPEAVALLRPRLLEPSLEAWELSAAMLDCLAAIRTHEAQSTLAEYLRRALTESRRMYDLEHGVIAFGRAVSQRFADPNANLSNERLRRAGERALQWWAAKNPS